MLVPDAFKRATDGFYQGAIESDGRPIDELVASGVRIVPQSRCEALLGWLDDLVVAEPDVVSAAWSASGCEYDWEDPEFIRSILRLMRERVAERVATGGGGMPG